MKKNIFVVLSLLVVIMFLVGCATQEELSQEDQQALDSELNQMSDEQLDQVIEEGESGGETALAGQAYSKYKASKRKVLARAYRVKLARASCDATGTLLEGETNNYIADGINYEITVTNFLYQAYAGGVHSVEFSVNGETFTLLEGESYTLADGGTIKLTNMLYQAYAGGVHSASFCLNAGVPACDESFTLLEGETRDLASSGSLTLTSVLYQAYAGGVHSATLCFND